MRAIKLLSLIVTVVLFAGCQLLGGTPGSSTITIGPTLTETIAIPLDEAATSFVALTLAPGPATVALDGGAENLVDGDVRVNVAAWRPVVSADATGGVRIIQQAARFSAAPQGVVNEWRLRLGEPVTSVMLTAPAGDYQIDLGANLPDGAAITIEVSAGEVRLAIPPQVGADVTTHGPITVKTTGDWDADGNRYRIGGSEPRWTITVALGVGTLILVQDDGLE